MPEELNRPYQRWHKPKYHTKRTVRLFGRYVRSQGHGKTDRESVQSASRPSMFRCLWQLLSSSYNHSGSEAQLKQTPGGFTVEQLKTRLFYVTSCWSAKYFTLFLKQISSSIFRNLAIRSPFITCTLQTEAGSSTQKKAIVFPMDTASLPRMTCAFCSTYKFRF